MTRKEKLRETIIRNLKKIDKYSEEIKSLSKDKEDLEISTKELQEMLNELVSPEANHQFLRVCDLEYVEGTFPTPYGVVTVSHKKLPNGTISSEIDAPKEVRIIK